MLGKWEKTLLSILKKDELPVRFVVNLETIVIKVKINDFLIATYPSL